jgi:hypothetical protein
LGLTGLLGSYLSRLYGSFAEMTRRLNQSNGLQESTQKERNTGTPISRMKVPDKRKHRGAR